METWKLYLSTTIIVIVSILYFYPQQEDSPNNQDIDSEKVTQASSSEYFVERTPQAQFDLPSSQNKKPISITETDCWEKIQISIEEHSRFLKKLMASEDNPVGLWLYNRHVEVEPLPVETPADYFYRGLLAADMLSGRHPDQPNFDEAIKLLKKAHELDPENSAPLLILGTILDNQDRKEEAMEHFELAENLSHRFDSYATTVGRHIYSQVGSPKDVIATTEIIAQLPIVNYKGLSKFLRKYHGEDFGIQMVSQGANLDNTLEFIHYDTMEYVLGYSLLKDSPEGAELSSWQDLWEERKGKDEISKTKIWEEMQTDCSLSKMEPLVDLYQMYGNS